MEQMDGQNNENIVPEQNTKKRGLGQICQLGFWVIILLGIFFTVRLLVNLEVKGRKNVLSNRVYQMRDESSLYLYQNGTYSWYKNNEIQDDNYYSGTYEVYIADKAEDYIVENLKAYGVTREEFQEFYQMNSDEMYTKENLCCLVLNSDLRFIDGEKTTKEECIPYFGFCNGETYELANMNTGNYLAIKNVESIE